MEDFFVSANLLDIGFSGELVIGGGYAIFPFI